MTFTLYEQDDEIQLNRFGIAEPVNRTQAIDSHELNVVLVPLRAFDRHGHRLGTGGGFYDRLFAKIDKQPILIGVGYAIQEAANLPADPWDLVLDGVLTENGLHYPFE